MYLLGRYNSTHCTWGAFLRNQAGVPLCLHLWESQGKFPDKRMVPCSILVPGDLSRHRRHNLRTP